MNINLRKSIFEKFQGFMSESLKDSPDHEKLMLFYEKFLKQILQQKTQEEVVNVTEQFSNFLVDQQFKNDVFNYNNQIFQNVAFSLCKVPFEPDYQSSYKRLRKLDHLSQQKPDGSGTFFKNVTMKWEGFNLNCSIKTLKSHFTAEFKKNCFLEIHSKLSLLDQLILVQFLDFIFSNRGPEELKIYLQDMASFEDFLIQKLQVQKDDFKELNFTMLKLLQQPKEYLQILNDCLESEKTQFQLCRLLKIFAVEILENCTRTFFQLLSKDSKSAKETNIEIQRRQLI